MEGAHSLPTAPVGLECKHLLLCSALGFSPASPESGPTRQGKSRVAGVSWEVWGLRPPGHWFPFYHSSLRGLEGVSEEVRSLDSWKKRRPFFLPLSVLLTAPSVLPTKPLPGLPRQVGQGQHFSSSCPWARTGQARALSE